MAFVFKLQGLLNWKKNLEELSQMRLAEKLKQLQVEEEEIQGLIEQRSAYYLELQEKSVRGLKAAEYLIYQHYFERSLQDLLLREEKKKITLREAEAEREKLVALTKQRKILEKLKEKRLKKFMYQSEREERSKNDERVISRYRSSPKVTFS
jgi:flagellar FliJ protein